ncbi:MAG TPA: hypothetical protein VM101_09320 [Flavitalea sp.]|nr:hypothetical protein [Flavitalea sp.]
MSIFTNIPFRTYLLYSAIAAIVYSAAVLSFLRFHDYKYGWILYIGNVLFFIVIMTFMIAAGKNDKVNRSSTYLLVGGHLLTIAAVVLACLISFLLISVIMPGLYTPGPAERVLTGEPEQMQQGKSNGLVFMIFMNAIIFNFSFGSFASVVYAFYAKRDQTKEGRTSYEGKL